MFWEEFGWELHIRLLRITLIQNYLVKLMDSSGQWRVWDYYLEQLPLNVYVLKTNFLSAFRDKRDIGKKVIFNK